MRLTYHSGEEIHQGDLVTYGGNAGMIALVVDGAGNPETDWYLENCGVGVMAVEPKVFGRVYIHGPYEDEDPYSRWPCAVMLKLTDTGTTRGGQRWLAPKH